MQAEAEQQPRSPRAPAEMRDVSLGFCAAPAELLAKILGRQETDLIKQPALFLDKETQLRPLGSHRQRHSPRGDQNNSYFK